MKYANGQISVTDKVPCTICKMPSVSMATLDGKSGVEWCENGHVVAIDYHGSGYKQIYDFATHT